MLNIRINCGDYMDKLVDYSLMKIYAIAVVRETSQTWTEEDDFAVDKPKMQLAVGTKAFFLNLRNRCYAQGLAMLLHYSHLNYPYHYRWKVQLKLAKNLLWNVPLKIPWTEYCNNAILSLKDLDCPGQKLST